MPPSPSPLPHTWSTTILSPFESNDIPAGLAALEDYLAPGYEPTTLHVHLMILLALRGERRALHLLSLAPFPSMTPDYDPDCPLFAAAHDMFRRSFWDVVLVDRGDEEGVSEAAWGVLEWAVTRWEERPEVLLAQISGKAPRWDVSRAMVIVRDGLESGRLARAQLAERMFNLLLAASTPTPDISPTALCTSLIDVLVRLPAPRLLDACIILSRRADSIAQTLFGGTIRRLTGTTPPTASCRTWADLSAALVRDRGQPGKEDDPVRLGILRIAIWKVTQGSAKSAKVAEVVPALEQLERDAKGDAARIPALARKWAGVSDSGA